MKYFNAPARCRICKRPITAEPDGCKCQENHYPAPAPSTASETARCEVCSGTGIVRGPNGTPSAIGVPCPACAEYAKHAPPTPARLKPCRRRPRRERSLPLSGNLLRQASAVDARRLAKPTSCRVQPGRCGLIMSRRRGHRGFIRLCAWVTCCASASLRSGA